MIINRVWAMPNKNTFQIKPIKELIERYIEEIGGEDKRLILNPFSNTSTYGITNDIDETIDADYHMDAIDFLKSYSDNSVDMVLYDPPFSPRQVSECYTKCNKTVDMKTTQASYWGNQKKEIGRIVKKDGIVICCGWNTGGIGVNNGFEIVEILLVPHGGWHNDTIVTVCKKNKE